MGQVTPIGCCKVSRLAIKSASDKTDFLLGKPLEKPCVLNINPYQILPGPQLDGIIHEQIMKMAVSSNGYPAYSNDTKLAKRVLGKLESANNRRVTIGRTHVENRTWFARFETNSMDGTEVLAETFALAVCRLALLHLEELKGVE